MKKNKIYKNKKGFALLFSVLVSSLLLTIGLSIFGIALKELAISTASRQSIHAFYAADSGLECAKYWDTKKGNFKTVSADSVGKEIKCGNSNITLDVRPNNLPYSGSEPVTTTFSFLVGNKGPKTEVSVQKSLLGNDILTSISATGWDSDNSDRVERGLNQEY